MQGCVRVRGPVARLLGGGGLGGREVVAEVAEILQLCHSFRVID